MENLNILSLVLATLVPTVVGFIYYSKPLFGNAWMDAIGMTEEKQKEANLPVIMGLSLVMSFLIAFFFVNFCNGIGQEGEFDTFKHGVAHGVIINFFLIIPILVTKGLYEQRSWKGILIDAGYWIITLGLIGGIIDAMNHFPNA